MKNILMMTDDGYDNGNRIKFVIYFFYLSYFMDIKFFLLVLFLNENESYYHRQIIFIHIHLFLLI